MNPEHSPTPEDIGRASDGSFEIPPDHAETPYNALASIEVWKEQVALLAGETKLGVESALALYQEVLHRNRDFDDRWPDLRKAADDVFAELTDTYTAYKNRTTDEEEVQVKAIAIQDSLRSILAMMDPDEHPDLMA